METPTTKTTSQEVVKAQINVALTTQSLFIQKMQDEANKLIVDEDHLQEISDFISKTKKADKIIDDKHKEVKQPYLDAGRNCDAAKNDLKELIESVRLPIVKKYTALCQSIESRKQAALRDEARKKEILSGIENNVMNFSSKIASAYTLKELQSVESLINLEKTRKSKYEEYHQQAIDKFDLILIPILKNQKAKIKEQEDIQKQIDEAANNSKVEAMDALKEKRQQLEDEIKQNQIDVQEAALNQTPTPTYEAATVVYPTVKARRTTFKWRVKDINLLAKKMPHLVQLVPVEEAINQLMKSKKTDGSLKEENYFGIEFYEEKLY